MMRIYFSLLVACSMLPAGLAQIPATPEANPAAVTMTQMKAASVLIAEAKSQCGSYPTADGELRTLRQAWFSTPECPLLAMPAEDGWRHPLFYRASDRHFQVISYGADATPDTDYAEQLLYSSRFAQVRDAEPETADIVLVDGRFVQRPFGQHHRDFETLNALNLIYMASASYAVDNNSYPGIAGTLSLVDELAPALVPNYIPELPTRDAWGHPLLYANTGQNFMLASWGKNGKADRDYASDLPCGLGLLDTHEGGPGADIVLACGVLLSWPRATR